MKRILSVMMCLVIISSFAACGGGNEKKAGAEITLEATELISGDTLVINVKSEGLDFEKGPWVGIAPAGDYKTEGDMDDNDIWYEYIGRAEQTFETQLWLESGTYVVAVCESDEDPDGAVLAAAEFTFTKTESEEEEEDENENGEKDRYYWADKYGLNVCPFYISINGEETKYFFRNGGELKNWVYTEDNTDGWYWYNGMVISKDGKHAVGPEFEYFSSFCTYEALPYDGPVLTEEEQNAVKEGVLYVINSYTPINTNWGIALLGEGDEDVETSCTDIRSSFAAGENIRLYTSLSQTDEPMTAEIYVLPHQDGRTFTEEMTVELKQTAVTGTIFAGPVTSEEPAAILCISDRAPAESEDGRFDIILTYDDMIVCWTVISITE